MEVKFMGMLAVCLLVMDTAQAAKILMIPPDHHSNANYMAVAGGALVETGHEVHFLSVPRHKKMADRHGMKGMFFHPVNYTDPTELMRNITASLGMRQMMTLMGKAAEVIGGLCHQMLGDEKLYAQIEAERFDVAVVESFDFVRCLMVIPYRHGIPHISLSIRHDPWSARVPASPSAEGQFGLHPFADPYNPTMWERWRSFLVELVMYVVMPWAMDDELISRYAPNRPAITMRELYQSSELTFVNMETCCLDTPRVSAPHYVYLGGIGTEPAKPLTGEFKDFAENAEDGLVVVTFGSIIKVIPMPRMEAMMAAFKQIPQRVVMRYDGPTPPEVPRNVKLSKWLPQNDLLGHPKTGLFVTHGGGNGQMEALYHGVPFVSIPVMGDQAYNAERGVARGFGTKLDFHTFTADELLSSIRVVIDDPSYSERIKRCSQKYRSLPSPQKTLAFWVEHVIKHGGSHLKPPSIDMPLGRWFNLDILFICFILTHLNIHIAKFIFKGFRFVARKVKGGKTKSD